MKQVSYYVGPEGKILLVDENEARFSLNLGAEWAEQLAEFLGMTKYTPNCKAKLRDLEERIRAGFKKNDFEEKAEVQRMLLELALEAYDEMDYPGELVERCRKLVKHLDQNDGGALE